MDYFPFSWLSVRILLSLLPSAPPSCPPLKRCFTSFGITLVSLLLPFSSLMGFGCLCFSTSANLTLSLCLSTLVLVSSGLHRDAVWPCSRGCVHHGLQLPAVCTAGLCHCPVQLRQQAGLRIKASSCPLRLPSPEWSCLPVCGDSPAYPVYIGLLPDEPLALSGLPGPASQELAPLPPLLRQRSGVCMKEPE